MAAQKSTEGFVVSTIYRRKSKSSQGEEQDKASSTAEELVPEMIPDQGCISRNVAPHASQYSVMEEHINTYANVADHLEDIEKHRDTEKNTTTIDDLNPIGDDIQCYLTKRRKKVSSDEVKLLEGTHTGFSKHNLEEFECAEETSNDKSEDAITDGTGDAKHLPDEASNNSGCLDTLRDEAEVVIELHKMRPPSIADQNQGTSSSSEWKPIEKELYLKGVEIFGRNRYLESCGSLSNKLFSCIFLFLDHNMNIYFLLFQVEGRCPSFLDSFFH